MNLYTRFQLGSWDGRVEATNLSLELGNLTGWTVLGDATDPSPIAGSVRLSDSAIQRTLTGLEPGERLTLQLRARWRNTISGTQRLPRVTMDDGTGGHLVERYVATTSTTLVGQDEPANVMLVDYTVPDNGQLRLTLYGDTLPVPAGTRWGSTDYDQLQLLRGDVFHLELDGRFPEPDPAAGLWVLDGWTQGWDLGDDWPAQPEPATASCRLAAVGAPELPPLEIGTRVSVWVQALYPVDNNMRTVYVARYEGRISDAAATPALLPVDDGAGGTTTVRGVAVELTLVDLNADAAEDWIGARPWAQQTATIRVQDILLAGGQSDAFGSLLPVAYDYFRPLDVDHRSIADVLEEHLAQLTRYSGTGANVYGWQRGILTTEVAGRDGFVVTDPGSLPGEDRYRIQLLTERSTMDGGPLRLVRVGDQVTVALEPGTGRGHKVMDGDYVDLSVEWRRDKGRATNRVSIGGEFAGLYGELGSDYTDTEGNPVTPTVTQVVAEWPDVTAQRGKITLGRDSTLAYVHSAKLLANMLLGDRADSQGRWAVESATFYLSELADWDTAMRLLSEPALFPDPISRSNLTLAPQNALPYGKALVIHNVEDQLHLEDVPYLAGALAGTSLTVANGQAAITVKLRPGVPRQHHQDSTADSPNLPASPLTLARRHPGTTVRDKGDGTPYIDPSLTPYQLRLARNE